jgi:hypothetical protein
MLLEASIRQLSFVLVFGCSGVEMVVSSHLLIPYIYYMVHCCGMNSWLFSAQSTPSTELKVVSYSEEMSSIVYCAFIWSIRRRDCLVSSGESKIWHEALYAYR